MTSASDPYHCTFEETEVFAKHWHAPTKLPHAQKVLMARYEKAADTGVTCEVYVTARPERVYEIKVWKRSRHGVKIPERLIQAIADVPMLGRLCTAISLGHVIPR